MMARVLTLDRLERISGDVNVLRSATTRLGDIDRRTQLNLAPFGTVSLRCLDITIPCRPGDDDAAWILSRAGIGGPCGYLILTGLAALRILSATLGLPSPRSLRPLGAAERGIVSASIVASLRATAPDISVSIGSRPWRADGLARLVIGIDFGSFHEQARLDLPPEWLPARTSRALLGDATRCGLEIPFVVALAWTNLPAIDWSRARLGDAVVFDDWMAVQPGRDWPARIVCGAFCAEIMIGSEGHVRLVSEFRRHDETCPSTRNLDAIKGIGRKNMPTDDKQTASLTMLAAAPIQVVAEVGRLILRADEVAALRPGSILSIGPLRPTTVELRVGDLGWARGELVDVDGQLGVRLTALLHHAVPPASSAEADTLR